MPAAVVLVAKRFMDGRGPLHDVGLILAVGREPQQEAATVIISLTNGVDAASKPTIARGPQTRVTHR